MYCVVYVHCMTFGRFSCQRCSVPQLASRSLMCLKLECRICIFLTEQDVPVWEVRVIGDTAAHLSSPTHSVRSPTAAAAANSDSSSSIPDHVRASLEQASTSTQWNHIFPKLRTNAKLCLQHRHRLQSARTALHTDELSQRPQCSAAQSQCLKRYC
jgi:hypothetical protein